MSQPVYFTNEICIFIEYTGDYPAPTDGEVTAIKPLGISLDELLKNPVAKIGSEKRTLVIAKVPFPPKGYDLAGRSVEAALVQMIRDANDQLKTARQKYPGAPITIHLLSPNWYSGGLPASNVPGGGPGERPEPVETDDFAADVDMATQLAVTPILPTLSSNTNTPDCVDVFILDAFPDESMVAGKVKRLPQNHVLTSLFQSDTLKWYPRDNPVPGVVSIQLPMSAPGVELRNGDHDYDMSDHGLFIAGIINSIAPTATLHLIPILDDFGVGTMLSFAQGLEVFYQLRQAAPKRHFVVNLSFAYALSLPIQNDAATILADWQRLLGSRASGNALATEITEFIEETYSGSNSLIALVDPEVGYLVAAAGNDGSANNHPATRYPASHDSVISVGALKKKNAAAAPEVTDYSDLASALPVTANSQKGIWTFGGYYKGDRSEKNGILGLSSVERSGYVWWAGTSFSTAIVSGSLAKLWVDGSADAKQDLFSAIQNNRLMDRNGQDIGPVLDATQP